MKTLSPLATVIAVAMAKQPQFTAEDVAAAVEATADEVQAALAQMLDARWILSCKAGANEAPAFELSELGLDAGVAHQPYAWLQQHPRHTARVAAGHRPAARAEPTPRPSDTSLVEEVEKPAFGLLNTGEFLIRTREVTLIIPAELVPTMRAQLSDVKGGFQ